MLRAYWMFIPTGCGIHNAGICINYYSARLDQTYEVGFTLFHLVTLSGAAPNSKALVQDARRVRGNIGNKKAPTVKRPEHLDYSMKGQWS